MNQTAPTKEMGLVGLFVGVIILLVLFAAVWWVGGLIIAALGFAIRAALVIGFFLFVFFVFRASKKLRG